MGKSEEWDAIMRFNPMDISSYYNSWDAENKEIEVVEINFKSGHKVSAYLTMKEFEKLLNED